MSGGSYNYVCREFLYNDGIPSTSRGSDFERLVERAEALRPGSPGAVRLRTLFDLCAKVRSDADDLIDLMEAIEWFDSGDVDRDRVDQAFDALETK